MTLREENRRRTLEALVAGALELFSARGYDQVTIDEIAWRAGVGRRTVFRYFASKEDLLLFDHGDYVETFRRVLGESQEAPILALREAALAVSAELQQNRTQLLARLKLVFREPALIARYVELDRRFHEVILAGLGPKRRSPAAELRLRLFAGAAMGALNAGLAVWVQGGGRLDLQAAVHTVFQMLESGLG